MQYNWWYIMIGLFMIIAFLNDWTNLTYWKWYRRWTGGVWYLVNHYSYPRLFPWWVRHYTDREYVIRYEDHPDKPAKPKRKSGLFDHWF